MEIAIEKTGGYIYSRGLLAIISTIVHWIAFAIIGVPFAAAGVVGGARGAVRSDGRHLHRRGALSYALIDDPVSAIWVLIVITVYQQIENYLLAPPRTQTMDIHPAVAFGGSSRRQHPRRGGGPAGPTGSGHDPGFRVHLRATPRGGGDR